MKTKPTPIAAAVTLALMGMMMAAQAQAQQAAAPAGAASAPAQAETQRVEVTGIRASLEHSLAQKRAADAHVEVITAEDVGKMPDKNVADSLARIPGVNISSAGANEGGFDENDRVSMRGTSPSLTQTLINGHNVASGDWFVLNQSGTIGRSVSYTLLPSELVGSVVVHKSSQASDIEGGVAGSVDIVTRKPLEFSKAMTLQLSAGAVYASLPSKTDPQFSVLANYHDEGRNFGVMLQLFSETRHLRRDGQEILGYDQIAANSAVAAAHPDLANVWYPRAMGSALFEQERKRTGGLLDLQLKITPLLTADFTGFQSNLSATNYNRNYLLMPGSFLNAGNGQAPDAGYVVQNGTLVSANFTGQPGRTYGEYDQISRPNESASTNFYNLDLDFKPVEGLNFLTKLGTSEGHGRTPRQDVGQWIAGAGTGGGWALHGTNTAADWNMGTQDNTQPGGLGWIWGDQNIDVVDKETYGQLDGEWSVDKGALASVKFGVRSASHSRGSWGVVGQMPGCIDASGMNHQWNWSQADWCDPGLTAANDPANWPQGVTYYPSNFGSGLGGNFPTHIWQYSPAQLAAFNALVANDRPYQHTGTDLGGNSYTYTATREDFNSEFGLKETANAGYFQANLDGDHWSGNVGLRLVQTTEHATNNVVSQWWLQNSGDPRDDPTPGVVKYSDFGNYVPITTTHTYTDALPSLNLKFRLNKETDVTVAASRTMTRPDYSALAGPLSLSPPPVQGATGTGSGANPDLKPIISNNFDTAWNWYFAPRSLVSAGLFYMDLTSYVGYGHVSRSYMTYSAAVPQGYLADYVITTPVNTKGSVKGVELAYQQPLFGNFGVSANYTYADGKESGGGPLVGTSKNTYNLSGYFENDMFNARLAYTHRSAFYSGLDRSTAFSQDATGELSASFGLKVNDKLSFTLDALNLNNPTLRYYALNRDQPRSIYTSGRQYYLNARVAF